MKNLVLATVTDESMSTKDNQSSDQVVLVLTPKQAEFLHKMLDGFICREAGNAIGTPSIIRKASQIGIRLSDAAGYRGRHNSR